MIVGDVQPNLARITGDCRSQDCARHESLFLLLGEEDTAKAEKELALARAARERAMEVCEHTQQWERYLEELALVSCAASREPTRWTEAIRTRIHKAVDLGHVVALEALVDDLVGQVEEPGERPVDSGALAAAAQALLEQSAPLLESLGVGQLAVDWKCALGCVARPVGC